MCWKRHLCNEHKAIVCHPVISPVWCQRYFPSGEKVAYSMAMGEERLVP
jgi:hypothetical protein